MNKKGFTLTELLVVVAIIGVLSLIIVPSVVKINKNINQRLYEQKIEYIETAAELYAGNNPDIFNGSDVQYVYVSELLQDNYLEADVNDDTCDYAWNFADETETNMEDDYKLSTGCVSDPVTSTSMNNYKVKLTKKTVGISAVVITASDTTEIDDTTDTLVNKICKGFENGNYLGKYGTGENETCKCVDKSFTENGVTVTKKILVDSNTNKRVSACLIVSNQDNGSVNNWLKYSSSSANWRVLGLYDLGDLSGVPSVSAKMITSGVVD